MINPALVSLLLTIFLRGGTTLSGSAGTIRPNIAPVAADMLIATHGDSITRDQDQNNYVFALKTLIVSSRSQYPRLVPRGINGISYNYRWSSEPYTETMITDAPISVDPLRTSIVTSWLIVFAGTNGMNGSLGNHSAATEYTNFKTYIAARISAGWSANKIVVVTMLPRTGFTDATRQTFNASLVGDDGSYGYRLARVDQNANIGAAGADTNTTYFYDGTHPTPAGHAIIGQVIYNAMFP